MPEMRRRPFEPIRNNVHHQQIAARDLLLDNPQAFFDSAALPTFPQNRDALPMTGPFAQRRWTADFLPNPSLNDSSRILEGAQSQFEQLSLNLENLNTFPQMSEHLNNDPEIHRILQQLDQAFNTPQLQRLCRCMLADINNNLSLQNKCQQIALRTRNSEIFQLIQPRLSHIFRTILQDQRPNPALTIFAPLQILTLKKLLSMQNHLFPHQRNFNQTFPPNENLNLLINDFDLLQPVYEQLNNDTEIQTVFQEMLAEINTAPGIQTVFQEMQQSIQNNQSFQQILQNANAQQRATLELALETPVSILSLFQIIDVFSRNTHQRNQILNIDSPDWERTALLSMAQALPSVISALGPQILAQTAIQAQEIANERNWFYRFINGIEDIFKSIWNLIKGLFCC
jgi:hypothetical protein